VQTIQVTDVGSKTTVGSSSYRKTNITLLSTIDEEMTEQVLRAAKRGHPRVPEEGTGWKKDPAYLQLP
jgi:hypothetical protein